MNRKINRKVFSSVWVALDQKLNDVAENRLQGGKGRVRTRQMVGDSTWFSMGRGGEWFQEQKCDRIGGTPCRVRCVLG